MSSVPSTSTKQRRSGPPPQIRRNPLESIGNLPQQGGPDRPIGTPHSIQITPIWQRLAWQLTCGSAPVFNHTQELPAL